MSRTLLEIQSKTPGNRLSVKTVYNEIYRGRILLPGLPIGKNRARPSLQAHGASAFSGTPQRMDLCFIPIIP